MTITSTLHSVSIFSRLRDEDVEQLATGVRSRTYPKKSVIIFQDDPGDALYLIASGRVKIVLTAEDGREVILSTREKGDSFGEISLIDDEPRAAHVIAMENSELLILHRDHFQRCVEEIPGIALGVLRSMCVRLREADSLIGGLVLLDVPGRLAQLIFRMVDKDDPSLSLVGLTHQTMAQMAGSTRETVSRTIRNFVDKGWIESARKRVIIKNREALEALVGSNRVPARRKAAAKPPKYSRRTTD